MAESVQYTPYGRGTEEHAEAAKELVKAPQPTGPDMILSSLLVPLSDGLERQQWDRNGLPNKAWWSALQWGDILSSGATTYVQVPERYRGAVLAARQKTLEVLSHAKELGPAHEEWKLFLTLDLLLLSRTDSGSTCAGVLEERLAWFWGSQWGALWHSLRAGRGHATKGHTATTLKQKVQRVHTLAASGEVGRALTACTSGRMASRTPQTIAQVRECFPVETGAAAPRFAGGTFDREFVEAVEVEIRDLLRKPPKLSAPGILGTRLEHLSIANDDENTMELLSRTIASIALGNIPQEVLQAMRVGEAVALQKDTTEIRPLLVSSTIRRLGLRAVARVKRRQLTEAAGSHQYGVGRKGGAQLLVSCIQAQAETRPDAVFAKVDLKSAFQKVKRQPAFAAVEEKVPEVASVMRSWYSGPVQHLWRTAGGNFETVDSHTGFDQGCPLAAAAFSVAQRIVLERFLEELRRIDPQAKMYSYLDDTYLVLAPATASLALTGLNQALAPIGLALNARKTAVWSPAGAAAIPQELQSSFISELPVLGSYLKSAGETGESPFNLGGAGCGLDVVAERLQKLWLCLKGLGQAGLQRQAVGALLRSYAGPASQHALRLSYATAEDAERYDRTLAQCWAELAERPLDEIAVCMLGLPVRMGGCGVQYAGTRRHAAYFAAWSSSIEEVSVDLGCATVAECLESLPGTARQLELAREGLTAQGLNLASGATLADAVRHPMRQGLAVEKVQMTNYGAVMQRLSFSQQAQVRGGGGPGSAGFLMYPADAQSSVENSFWSVAVRQRLGLRHAECSEDELAHACGRCQLRTAAGHTCAQPLDDNGYHASICQPGGGVLRRHGHIITAVSGLIQRWRHHRPMTEQRVPAWDRPSRSPTPTGDGIERAILDIEYSEADGRTWIDVSVRHPAAGEASDVRRAAKKDGEASRRGEQEKHARYPGSRLVPFVVEMQGRVGAEARQWLRAQVRELPADRQIQELTRAYGVISCALQGEVARQMRKAAGLK